MDAIDKLIFSSQAITVECYKGTIYIVFPSSPSEETLAPVNRVLSIEGLFGHTINGKYVIFCPSTYDSFETAQAICSIWKNTGISFKLYKGTGNELNLVWDFEVTKDSEQIESQEIKKEVLEKRNDFTFNFKYYPRLPENYGEYWFKLTDNSKIYGYYSSFAYPHNRHIRIVNLKECQFYYIEYKEIAGYFGN